MVELGYLYLASPAPYHLATAYHYQGKMKVNNTSELRTAKELVKLLVGEELRQVANEHLLVVREDLRRNGRTAGVITGVTTATLLVRQLLIAHNPTTKPHVKTVQLRY